MITSGNGDFFIISQILNVKVIPYFQCGLLEFLTLISLKFLTVTCSVIPFCVIYFCASTYLPSLAGRQLIAVACIYRLTACHKVR